MLIGIAILGRHGLRKPFRSSVEAALSAEP
jgi:hypothetical protein